MVGDRKYLDCAIGNSINNIEMKHLKRRASDVRGSYHTKPIRIGANPRNGSLELGVIALP